MKSLKRIDIINAAVSLVFLCTPIESIGVFGESSRFSLVRLTFLFLLVIWLFFSLKAEFNTVIKGYIVLASYFLIACIWSIDLESSLVKLLTFLFPTILLCSIVSANLQTKKDFSRILIAYLIGCSILSITAYLNRDRIIMDATYGDLERISALGQDPNEFAVLLNLGVGILLHYLGTIRKLTHKIALWAVVFFWSFVILSTGSRTGAVILGSLLIVFLMNNKRSIPVLLPVLIIVGGFLFQYVSDGIVRRLSETVESIQANDMSERGQIWQWGWTAFQDENMVLGVGYCNFPQMLISHGYLGRASHNTYLSYLICGGFIGFLIFLWILAKLLSDVYSIHKADKKWNMLYYILPLFLGMFTLETINRRWLFLIMIVIYKYSCILKQEQESLQRSHDSKASVD